MSREIKFRFWEGNKLQGILELKKNNIIDMGWEWDAIDQYTGLKDKNGLEDIYEGDIIDVNGLKKGNVYENEQEATDLVIEGFGTKTWVSTYQEAMERGCKNAE